MYRIFDNGDAGIEIVSGESVSQESRDVAEKV